MISKARLKYIKSLQVKKYRKQEQCFVVEGAKGVRELLGSDFETVLIVGTEQFLDQAQPLMGRSKAEILTAKPSDLEQIGAFQSNDSGLAVARMRDNVKPVLAAEEFALVLDDIRDPGNLGTIIRTADWYGLRHIIASEETADLYNSKVINATMGSFTRVNVYYINLIEYLRSVKGFDTYGAFLNGEDVHTMSFGKGGLIVIGNESAGISDAVGAMIKKRITIPRIGSAESLNASVAAGVILDNVTRTRSRL
jgi:TrmH family RNA methyltransferase